MTAVAAPSRLPWLTPADLLLLRVLAAPPEAALEPWRLWLRDADLDHLPWRTVRLAAAALGRLGALGLGETREPRLLGVRRYVWSNGQAKLAAAGPVLADLAAAGIAVMVLKGGAAMAAGDASPADRYVGDIDILVSPAAADHALDRLAALGWQPQQGGSIARVKGRDLPRHHAVNLVCDGQGELDLHWCFLKENRLPDDDATLWRDSVAAELRGQRVLIPSPHHRLLQALVQGAQWSAGNAADWAIDALALLRRPELEPERVAGELAARRLEAFAALTLDFLAEELGLALPPPLRDVSAGAAPWRHELAAKLVPPDAQGEIGQRAIERAMALRAGGRRPLFAERLWERRLLLPALSRLLPGGQPLEVEQHHGPDRPAGALLRLPHSATGRRLLVELEVPPGPRRCRIEAVAGTQWLGRWRHPAGRRAWQGLRLSPQALAAASAHGILVEAYAELRRPAEGGVPQRRDDGPVTVRRALLFP